MASSPGEGARLEQALTELIVQLDRGGFEETAERAGERVLSVLQSADSLHVEAGEKERIKHLYALAMGTLERRKEEIAEELGRVRKAQSVLRACKRPAKVGSDVNITG